MKNKMTTMDGNTAAAYVSYAFTDVAAIYPITPATTMSDEVDRMSFRGHKNLFGRKVKVVQMQSEAGASGTVHGAISVGALSTTYTASQGLLLMIPNMYKMAGELLPNVIHVSSRTIATHALSICGDHSDIYACRQTGYAILCSNNPQEVMHLAAVAHLSTIRGRIPFLHFFDGFRTSHEMQKIHVWDYSDLSDMLDWESINIFREHSLNPEHPTIRGTAQNDDVFFQNREACNKFYDRLPDVVCDYMNEVNKRTGTDYRPFNYYGHPCADRIIVAMGSVCNTIEEVVDYLNTRGEKVGLVKVRLYRPFVYKFFQEILPLTAKKISVLDRTKEPGSIYEPLCLDVIAAVNEFAKDKIEIYGGRYGLSSKDTNPSNILAVYENMRSTTPKKKFTIGINDDVTHLSLNIDKYIYTSPKDVISCKFWGLGSDGTIGANKNTIKIIGDNTDMSVQGYFAYDSKKSGGVTVSHLRFGKNVIKSAYFIDKADFIACHNPAYIGKYDVIEGLKKGGVFLLNCSWDDRQIEMFFPNDMKKFIADNNIHLYVIDGFDIGKKIGLGGRINTVLQAAFFKIMEIIPIDKAVQLMKSAAENSYRKQGKKIIEMNYRAIECGIKNVREVKIPSEWGSIISNIDFKYSEKSLSSSEVSHHDKYINNILIPCSKRMGNNIPVSEFMERPDGTVPLGSCAYEKRGISSSVPQWIPENCIQCNICSYVCPHSVIRPHVLNNDEISKSPTHIMHKNMIGLPNLYFSINVSTLDCTGCGVCVSACPGMRGKKALQMKNDKNMIRYYQKNFDYCNNILPKTEVSNKFSPYTVKGSQFKQPLLEFSGACAGCGETPYAKLATQLFGDKMYIANATGCSSIWGASFPYTPYTKNHVGKGPAWQNSLFEDNAEFGYGMFIGQEVLRESLLKNVKIIKDKTKNQDLRDKCESYIKTFNDSKLNGTSAQNLIDILNQNSLDATPDISKLREEILKNKDYLSKKSVWIFGGDGWAYDIGFGGLDHVISTGKNVNILVFDTEVYSNTGGQSSKATPLGAVVQFASGGKATAKKDLASIAMTYGNVYVAQVAIGANYNQCIKAFVEAESYEGTSIIIAYSPCINHGIKGSMCSMLHEQKKAVESGYWNLFRFNPQLKKQNRNPFILDSKADTSLYKNFIENEIRYDVLTKIRPEYASNIFHQAQEMAEDKYKKFLHMSENNE